MRIAGITSESGPWGMSQGLKEIGKPGGIPIWKEVADTKANTKSHRVDFPMVKAGQTRCCHL